MRGPRAGRAISLVVIAAIATLTAARAGAQHDHHHGSDPAAEAASTPRPFAVELTVIGARFDQVLYRGDYVGLGLAVAWHRGRVGVSATLPAYHLRKNGAAVDGIGDVTVGVEVVAYRARALSAGLSIGSTLPTGASMTGLGMGHAMLMPALWLARDGGRASITVSAGWCRAIGAAADHEHGAWPLVAPMSRSELMTDVRGDVAVAGRLRALARLGLALPLADEPTRVIAAIGARWHGPVTQTGAELQAGLAGDPFTIRALITSAVRF